MKTVIFCLLLVGSLVRAQELPPTVEFLCEGHSNWVSAIKFFTTADRIRFIGPLDRSYGNACEAEKGGIVRFLVDSTHHSVELRVDSLPEPHGCPRNYAPVYSMAAEFGPLAAADWVFWSADYKFTNFFTVYPNPSPTVLQTRIEAGLLRLEWPAVAYLQYELEASTTLTNWQPAQVNYTLEGSTMRTTVAPETPHQFFRIKRSSITQPVPSYPTDCGA